MGRPRTYHIATLGCPKNEVDSGYLEALLAAEGLAAAATPAEADAIIVNTCGFITGARDESYEVIADLLARKQGHQLVVVAGCLTQLYASEVARRFPQVDHVFGVGQWPQVARLLGANPEAVHDVPQTHARAVGASAYLKIADGCDAPCTFCVIPRIKGSFHSAPAEILVSEAEALVAGGVKEIVLVAQDTTAWGEDLGHPVAAGLPALLRTLAGAVGRDVWLRIMYAYPSRVGPALIEAMATIPNVLPYLDMPLQHGSEAVLRRMKRPHRLDRILRTVEDLRQAIPGLVLRTSFIAGHPGETEEEFEELLAFAREIQFDHAGCFTYSRQPFTPDFDVPGQLPEETKEERRARFMEMQREISARRASRFVGCQLDVLVEGTGSHADGETLIVGRSYREAPEVDGLVIARGSAGVGEKVTVEITATDDYDLLGVVR